jgi:hypothetical protein
MHSPFSETAPEPPDEQLVSLAQGGDRHALEQLVARHGPWILNVAARMVWRRVEGRRERAGGARVGGAQVIARSARSFRPGRLTTGSVATPGPTHLHSAPGGHCSDARPIDDWKRAMCPDAKKEALTREAVLALLSDAEVAKVSRAEGEPRPVEGDEYVDLEGPSVGVRQVHARSAHPKSALPRSSGSGLASDDRHRTQDGPAHRGARRAPMRNRVPAQGFEP